MLDRISAHAFAAESACLPPLLEAAVPFRQQREEIRQHARDMVERLRTRPLGFSVEAFLQEYSLSTKEGIAVMCLAEALLRIPDRATADRLIGATLHGAEWERHLGHSPSLFVNASSWGLVLTGRTLDLAEQTEGGAAGLLGRLARRLGEPVIREALKAAMRLLASQFVLGETVEEALEHSVAYGRQGYRFSYDMLGEGARSRTQADAYLAAYHQAIEAVGRQRDPNLPLYAAPSISIKLTALHPRYEWRRREQVMAELLPRLVELAQAAHRAGLCIAIDAEEATRLDLELWLFEALVTHPDLREYHGIGFVLQAYQKRAFPLTDWLIDLSRRSGKRLPVRLVKGAYWDAEIKAAQIAGLPGYPVFTAKAHTDLSYLACARRLLDHPECFYPQFATHNALTISSILAYAGDREYEFQRLHGMGEALYEEVVAHTPCRIYAPIGRHRDLLAYLIRRLLENGANSSFVRLLHDASCSVDAVLEDPIAASQRHPEARLPPPVALYDGDRQNSEGLDPGNRAQMAVLARELAAYRHGQWQAGQGTLIRNPARLEEVIGQAAETGEAQTQAIIARAHAAFAAWSHTPVDQRAARLEKTAERLQARRAEAMALIIREGGRNWADALSEVREAEDFCRYYAARARELFGAPQVLTGPTGEHNELSFAGRGVFGCISPWNFPLAIFLGQAAAALAAGNTVIAKPAEQTPLTAAFALGLLHEAGVPPDAAILLTGRGEVAGAALVRDERVAGIAFTGGTATAKAIQRQLAARDGPIVPLIAETGGQNAMIVDSSALIEQAVDDIVNSAFGSAGQRCSALRLLFVHRDIADELLALLAGAMQELRIGDPWEAATDLGPVIDSAAKAALERHVDDLRGHGRLIAATPLPGGLPDGHWFAPQAWEIDGPERLKEEIFGPILHVVRYDPARFDAMLEIINASGYGLTFGIHTRIPDLYRQVTARVKAGNCYVNRSMIGATVGVQPFGGEGLSGTGPKAGGPYYLLRFATERALSINTAAIGGNIDLLAT